MNETNLKTQLTWTPLLVGSLPEKKTTVVVGGMGGSALPAYAARFLDASFPVSVHHDYDLPETTDSDTLYIAISYSGNTAETLSFAHAAHDQGLSLVVITSGGALAEFAREKNIPHCLVPNGTPPRDALFFLLRAFSLVTKRESFLDDLASVSFSFDQAEEAGTSLAKSLENGLPIFYASRRNGFLARVAKIQMNETAKMPAFANVFPEMNHNEMESFDTPPEAVAALARFVIMHDAKDDARVARRMTLFAEVMRERGHIISEIVLPSETRAETLVYGWYVAYHAAMILAEKRGVNPDTVPLVEDFKSRL